MLTREEKAGIEKILGLLDTDQVRSLASTICKGKVTCTSHEECIRVVLSFETSAEDFLHRKLISKKLLAQYAFEERFESVNECKLKEELVQKIISYWSSASPSAKSQVVANRSLSTQPLEGAKAHNPVQGNNTFNVYNVHVNVEQTFNTVETNNNHTTVHDPTHSQDRLNFQFGETFCAWFYAMLNHNNPSSEGFGPTHFMADAKLFTKLVASNGNITENSVSNSMAVSESFVNLSKLFKFQPNISPEGMVVKSDPHGLKVLLVCGTIFKRDNLLTLCGTFQQSFGLVKDPRQDNNWKIHVSALKCVECYGNVTPCVDDSDLERIAIENLRHV